MIETIIKKKVKSNFITVSREIFKDKRLKLQDRGLLTTLLALPDEWEFTLRGLAAILPDGRDSIEKSLKRLEEYGYIAIIQDRSTRGKFAKNTVEIIEQPSVVPCPENPDTVKPDTDNPCPESPPQYKNNNYKNINEYKNNNNQKVNSFNRFRQRTYDYAELERDAIGFT